MGWNTTLQWLYLPYHMRKGKKFLVRTETAPNEVVSVTYDGENFIENDNPLNRILLLNVTHVKSI